MARESTDDLAARFLASARLLRAAWDRVPVAARQWRPAPGKWSAHEIVVHCMDASVNAHARIRYLVAEEDPVIVGYDQDRWVAALDYHAQPIAPVFATIDAIAASTAELVRRLDAAALARTGRHTETGAITLGTWFPYNADHLKAHAAQIDRNVAAFAARASR